MRILFSLLASLSLITYSAVGNASISLSATRIIYEGNMKEASIRVVNNGSQETLIQSWLEHENNQTPPPFAVTPPLAKIKGNQQQLLRVLYQGSGLPQDRESVFWLSVQEVPQQSEGANKLQLALRQRIKLFYRPTGLTGTALAAPTQLTVKVINSRLEFYNPTPYHINMVEFRQGALALKGKMIAPGASLTLEAPGIKNDDQFDITVVNDFGGLSRFNGNMISGLATALEVNKQPVL